LMVLAAFVVTRPSVLHRLAAAFESSA